MRNVINIKNRLRVASTAQELVRLMKEFPQGGTAVDEAETAFERCLLVGGAIHEDDFIEEIELDDVVNPQDPEKRDDILVVITADERIIQITAATGFVLVVAT